MCTPSASITFHSASTPYHCCPLLSRFSISTAGHVRRVLGHHILLSTLFLHEWDVDPIVPLAPAESTANRILIYSAIFAGLTIVTDWQTDRPRYSVCNSRSHLGGGGAMWPRNRVGTLGGVWLGVVFFLCRLSSAKSDTSAEESQEAAQPLVEIDER